MSRRYYGSRRNKYSNETQLFGNQFTVDLEPGEPYPIQGDKYGIAIVPATSIEGTRQIKNLTIRINATNIDMPLHVFVVYVPEGSTLGQIGLDSASGSLYCPPKNLICHGILNPDVIRDGDYVVKRINSSYICLKSPLARNLNSGDKIIMFLFCRDGIVAGNGESHNAQDAINEPVAVVATINYAIKY